MVNKYHTKLINKDILKDIYDPTIIDPPKPKLPKELKFNKKKSNKGRKA